ncbi:MAG: hypothetical protein IJG97_03020 [Bacilli bacterium]|nr:hypothetical protein [Bacilli bacterium]
MKKVFYLILLLISISTINVNAANYELKELIPVNVKTTIVTNNFSYQSFCYSDSELEGENSHNNAIIFENIKNISDKELPVSISLALFDKDRKNLSVINYCSVKDKSSNASGTKLKSKGEMPYSIEVDKSYLPEDKTVEDIKYIAILSDNINCNSETLLDYAGYPIEDISMGKNNTLDDDSQYLIKIMTIVGVVLLLLFLYNFMFTNAYQNMDGSDVRAGYRKYNKELKKERERELKKHPPVEPEPVKVKSDKVIEQEKQAQNEDKSGTDLHNLYK